MKIKFNYKCSQPGYCVDNCIRDYVNGCKDCDKNGKQSESQRILTEVQTIAACKRQGLELDDT